MLGSLEEYPKALADVKNNRSKVNEEILKLIVPHTLLKKSASLNKKADLTGIWTVSNEDGKDSIVRLFDLIPAPSDIKNFCSTLLSGNKVINVGDKVVNSSFKLVEKGANGVVERIDPKASKALSIFCKFDQGNYWVSPDNLDKAPTFKSEAGSLASTA